MKYRIPHGALASLGSALILAACQGSEPQEAETLTVEERIDFERPDAKLENMPRMEGGAKLVKPTEEELQKFLSKGEFPETGDAPAPAAAISQPIPAGKAAAAGYSCVSDYNGANSIGLIPDQAWNSVAKFPWYIQYCAYNSFIYTVPLPVTGQQPLDTHHHLPYENPYFCFIDPLTGQQAPAGKLGVYQSPPSRQAPKCADWKFTKCTFTTADAKNYARSLTPHGSGYWMQFYPKRDNVRKKFDLTSIRIPPNTYAKDGCYPESGRIQVWVKKAATQQWWYWDGLLPGYVWSPYPQDGADLDELQIATATGISGPFTVDDIKLNIHF